MMDKAFQFLLAGIFYGAVAAPGTFLKASKVAFPKIDGEIVSFIVENSQAGKYKVSIERVKE